MSASSIVQGIPGVRRCVVGSRARVLEGKASGGDALSVTSAAGAIAGELDKIGALLGLGVADILVTKGTGAIWVIAARSELSIAVEVDAGRPTAAVVSAIGNADWPSMIESDVTDSELEIIAAEHPSPSRRDVASRPQADVRDPESLAALRAAGPPRPSSSTEIKRMMSPQFAAAAQPLQARSGTNWRVAPKYRQVMMGPQSTPPSTGVAPVYDAASNETPPPSSRELGVEGPRSSRGSGEMAMFTGNLRLFCLPDLLEFLRGGQRTGTLVCSSKQGAGTIYMRGGKVTSASSPSSRSLGDYLVASGVLSHDDARTVAQIQQETQPRPRIGGALVRSGIVTAAQVREALSCQIRDALGELMKWVDGEFAFDSDAAVEASPLDVDLEFDPQAILLDIYKELDEGNFAAR